MAENCSEMEQLPSLPYQRTSQRVQPPPARDVCRPKEGEVSTSPVGGGAIHKGSQST
jgi:hypothetical protein